MNRNTYFQQAQRGNKLRLLNPGWPRCYGTRTAKQALRFGELI